MSTVVDRLAEQAMLQVLETVDDLVKELGFRLKWRKCTKSTATFFRGGGAPDSRAWFPAGSGKG